MGNLYARIYDHILCNGNQASIITGGLMDSVGIEFKMSEGDRINNFTDNGLYIPLIP
jgi:hypothetical protein